MLELSPVCQALIHQGADVNMSFQPFVMKWKETFSFLCVRACVRACVPRVRVHLQQLEVCCMTCEEFSVGSPLAIAVLRNKMDSSTAAAAAAAVAALA
eukprot:1727580-Amphidinium_carterae.1